ncbi:hypothetical protein CAI21_21690 [Alkalilimnicola ehrlichii]|uniref:HNH nuclease domain-containing protein n=1 Tax=Alkalilimnicola ehrlichii TaxID=351052 RepID=A0A3E0WSM3_9GAMM|nr:NUMOD4 motif-containing HNH endonuclease [Alkalilimnicola ehrlichii]RFA24438.1 hypothetical protein CAI21_21690 [Alkalilimnicola ehrlichii]RFA35151.1 hypothetical protein CAL65_13685 [Alkalilimnicola ehrlichii]
MEEWRPAAGFPGYEVSSLGRVRSLDRVDSVGRRRKGQILTNARRPLRTSKGGSYYRVRLRRNGRTEDAPIHVLVLESFVGPRPPGMHACHNDGDADNNALDNLRWDTPSSNQRDKVRHQTIARGEANGWAKLTETQVREIWLSPLSAPLLADELGVNKETIARIRRRELWAWFAEGLPPRPLRRVTARSQR